MLAGVIVAAATVGQVHIHGRILVQYLGQHQHLAHGLHRVPIDPGKVNILLSIIIIQVICPCKEWGDPE